MLCLVRYGLALGLIFSSAYGQETYHDTLLPLKTIRGKLSPKSVGHSGQGIFFAQNMMYRHTIHVYNSNFSLVKIIEDKVDLKEYGYDQWGEVRGAPVEVTFSHQGKYAWVSQYQMEGDGFDHPGCDACSGDDYDPGFIYKINTNTLKIEHVIKVGSVPKFMATTPDDKYILVSNWTSGDISIVSTSKNREIKKIPMGRHPRGIAINGTSTKAYVAIMGTSDLGVIDLVNFKVSKIDDVGKAPRHVCISPNDRRLYVSINNEGRLLKLDLDSGQRTYVQTGHTPRSMVLTSDGRFLYVVNYSSGTVSKVYTPTMTVVHTIESGHHPIGITLDETNRNVWVACYSGSINIYHDPEINPVEPGLFDNYRGFLAYIDDSYEASKTTVIEPETEQQPEVEEAEPVDEETMETTEESDDQPRHKFGIIAGAFSIHSNATNLVAELKSKGYPAYTKPTSNNLTYAIVSGHNSENEAESELEKVRKKVQSNAWIKAFN